MEGHKAASGAYRQGLKLYQDCKKGSNKRPRLDSSSDIQSLDGAGSLCFRSLGIRDWSVPRDEGSSTVLTRPSPYTAGLKTVSRLSAPGLLPLILNLKLPSESRLLAKFLWGQLAKSLL